MVPRKFSQFFSPRMWNASTLWIWPSLTKVVLDQSPWISSTDCPGEYIPSNVLLLKPTHIFLELVPIGLGQTPCTCLGNTQQLRWQQLPKQSQVHETQAWGDWHSEEQMAEWFYHPCPLTSETRSKEERQCRLRHQFPWAHPRWNPLFRSSATHLLCNNCALSKKQPNSRNT